VRIRAEPKKKKKWRPSRPSVGTKNLKESIIHKTSEKDEAAIVVDVDSTAVTAALGTTSPLAYSMELAVMKKSTDSIKKSQDGIAVNKSQDEAIAKTPRDDKPKSKSKDESKDEVEENSGRKSHDGKIKSKSKDNEDEKAGNNDV